MHDRKTPRFIYTNIFGLLALLIRSQILILSSINIAGAYDMEADLADALGQLTLNPSMKRWFSAED